MVRLLVRARYVSATTDLTPRVKVATVAAAELQGNRDRNEANPGVVNT